jgi:putative ABC transport system substrate-binding protein
MRRREFIAGLGSAAAWPLTVSAQPRLPVIGFLTSGSPSAFERFLAAFRRGLNESGYIEHRNIGIEYRWAEGRNDRLPPLAEDLVRTQVSVIFAGGPPAALAAKAAATTIPVVFSSGEDPIKLGLVASYNRPGGNVTGVAMTIEMLGSKRLGLLRQLVPGSVLIAVLLNPTEPAFNTELKDVQEAARSVGQPIEVLQASTEREIAAAFATAAELHAGAMFVGPSFLYTILRSEIVAFAARAALPTMYAQREFTSVGGLISYDTDLAEGYRQAGVYVGRILKGEKAADLPVMQPTKFDLIINLKGQRPRPHHPGNAVGHRGRVDPMRRREFIAGLGAATWPVAAWAQRVERVRRIGYLTGGRADNPVTRSFETAFVQALQQLGWTVGRNARLEDRFCLWRASRSRH